MTGIPGGGTTVAARHSDPPEQQKGKQMIMPDSVPTLAALALGAAGLAAGIAFGRISVREQLRQVKSLLPTVMNYARKGDEAYALARAIESPTMAVSALELLAPAGPRERFAASWHNGIERARQFAADLRPDSGHIGATAEHGLGLSDTPPVAELVTAPADNPGDTAIFAALVSEFYGDSAYTLPARPSPWVQPQIKHAPRGPQAAPKWEHRPAPARRGSLLELSAPAQRLPHDPRRMAMLDPDDSRWMRVRQVSS